MRGISTWWWVAIGGLLVAGIAVVVLAFTGGNDEEPVACSPVADEPEWTVARRWNEVLLNAIRRDLPAPTVHARNLFHTSAAMWDAWAAYDQEAAGYLVTEKHEADFGRALAEFWADGPDSETPPGHWNTLANEVSDTLDPDLRIGGVGEPVDRLEWDVKLYLAINGAAHDAAVAAWGAKGHYDYIRPISMIRYMGGLGQSTDPDGPAYHPDGLPLTDDLVEVVTAATTAPGERHESLAGHEGEIAVRAWVGTPDNPETDIAGVGWIRAVEWVPYQKPSFVTPAFAGYVSGHSTFSRAAAQVLAGFTGSEFFPGGLGEWTIPAGSLEFEAGPAIDITLQWATYADAADQAGISRLYGGIHVRADDLPGRVIGAAIGDDAWAKARTYFDGSAGR